MFPSSLFYAHGYYAWIAIHLRKSRVRKSVATLSHFVPFIIGTDIPSLAALYVALNHNPSVNMRKTGTVWLVIKRDSDRALHDRRGLHMSARNGFESLY